MAGQWTNYRFAGHFDWSRKNEHGFQINDQKFQSISIWIKQLNRHLSHRLT